jgi:peptidoglycan/LPS O-acetylase OafA/YrhL
LLPQRGHRPGTLEAIDAKAFYRRRAVRNLPFLLTLVAVLCGLALAGSGGDLRLDVVWYPPVPAGAWALGWLVVRFISNPLERALLRASASRASARVGALPSEVSA